MITKVRLKNWRSHEDTELNFSSGVNLVLGRMGSGKSSIMDAICFALFGTFPNIQQKKMVLDDVIQSKPKQKEQGSVTLWFNINGKEYQVKRIIEYGKGTTTSEIREDGNLLESPQASKVTEIVQSKLKIDYDLFYRAIYSEQNKIDYFLVLPKGQRMKKIDELLRIDKFEKVRSNANTLKNRVKNRFQDRLEDIRKMKENLDEDRIEEIKNNIQKLNTDTKEFSYRIENIDNDLYSLKESLNKMEKIREELEQKKNRNTEITSTINELKSSLKDFDKEFLIEKKNDLEDKINDYEKRIEEKREQIVDLQKKINENKVEFNGKKDELEDIDKKIDQKAELENKLNDLVLENNIEELQQKYENLKQNINYKQVQLENLRESIKNLEKSHDKCPTCDSELSEEKRRSLIDEKSKEIENIENELKIEENRLQEIELSLQQSQKISDQRKEIQQKISFLEIKDREPVKNRVDELREKIETLQEQISETDKEKTDLQKNLSELKENYSEVAYSLKQVEENEKRKQRLNELGNEKESIDKEIENLENQFSKDRLKELRERNESLLKERESLKVKKDSNQSIIKEKQIYLDEILKQKRSIEEKENETESMKKIMNDLENFKDAVQKTQTELRENFIKSVNETMNSIWDDLYPYEDFSSIRLHIDQDYILQLKSEAYNESKWMNVESVSGGERALASLCLRIAFSLVLASQLKWLVLDEPTHNLDQRAVETFSLVLREKVTKFVNQVFIITHEEKLEDSVTGSLHKLAKVNGITEAQEE